MTLPDGLQWAAPGQHPDDWCVRVADAAVMLCGRVLDGADRRRGFVPVIQPASVPESAHGRCVELLPGWSGVCLVCGGTVAVDAGVLLPHGMWRVTRDGLERTDEPCPGGGQTSEGGS